MEWGTRERFWLWSIEESGVRHVIFSRYETQLRGTAPDPDVPVSECRRHMMVLLWGPQSTNQPPVTDSVPEDKRKSKRRDVLSRTEFKATADGGDLGFITFRERINLVSQGSNCFAPLDVETLWSTPPGIVSCS
ncbi:hypothetical protein CBL_01104 [Carabus blaptoides fortunei]